MLSQSPILSRTYRHFLVYGWQPQQAPQHDCSKVVVHGIEDIISRVGQWAKDELPEAQVISYGPPTIPGIGSGCGIGRSRCPACRPRHK